MPAAQSFYGGVLGWSSGPDRPGLGSAALVEGCEAAALAAGAGPAAWTLFFATADLQATVGAVVDGGGEVVEPPVTLPDGAGRTAVAVDPTGARFGLLEAGSHLGSRWANSPGGITWEDLRSPDPVVSTSFFEGLFGYDVRPLAMAGPDYSTFHIPGDDAPLGGMGGLMGQDGPSRWLLYLAVADVDAAVAVVQQNGGTVVSPLHDSPFGRMAAVRDPWGAELVLMTVAPEQREPVRPG